MKTGRYSLFDLLTHPEIEQIIIPELQRDYVWEEINVCGLLDTIFSQYSKQTEIEFICQADGQTIDGPSFDFLKEEYFRMRFSTRIGFIYAYHDPTYAGKFFLIDGQQRITTLYLLLTALYCRFDYIKGNVGRNLNDFEKRYKGKLDFMVREVSHDFLYDMISYEIEHSINNENFNSATPAPFFDEDQSYCNLYAKDVTASHLLQNYKYINLRLSNSKFDILNLIDYVEHHIEFNYFDTNLSHQGEKLYLYMNSRGEGLQYQELVRATLIGKSKDKLSAGECWEEMQNFFWRHSGKNPNADLGFQEFLKWSVIIHLCSHNHDGLCVKKLSNEELEEYIKYYYVGKNNSPEFEKAVQLKNKQSFLLKKYIEGNDVLYPIDVPYIYNLYKALKEIFEPQNDTEKHFEHLRKECLIDKCLEEITSTSEYSVLFACLLYMTSFSESSTGIWPSGYEVRRLAMHVKMHMKSANNSRNPDRSAIQAIRLVEHMKRNNIRDISSLKQISDSQLQTYFISWTDRHLLPLIWANNPCSRLQWENAIWDTINDEKFIEFLNGNIASLLAMASNGVKVATPSLNQYKNYYNLFRNHIYHNLDSSSRERQLHKELLKYYDYKVYETIPGFCGWWMKRYQLLADKDQWAKQLSCDSENFDSYLIFIQALIKFLNDKERAVSIEMPVDYRRLLIKYGLDGYMQKYRYLYKESRSSIRPHILLNSLQVSDKWHVQEMLIRMLHKHKYFTYSHVFEHNILAVEFDIVKCVPEKQTYKFIKTKDFDKYYFLDIVYQWDDKKFFGKWYFKIGHRPIDVSGTKQDVPLTESQRKSLEKLTGKSWSLDDGFLKSNDPFYIDNPQKGTEESIVEDVVSICKKMLPQIAYAL